RYTIDTPLLRARLDAADGRTSKFLLAFSDGAAVEAVLMRQPYGNSICISTQAGCNMGCSFCASTLHGLARDLTAGEMLAEVLFIEEMLKSQGGKVDTMVLMGSGEPLMNYENVVDFLRLLHEEYVLNISYRSITLSTSGIVPAIDRLAEEGMPLTLSISLHAPREELRSELMPINRKYPLSDVVAAGKRYAEKTGRRVTYEYILIRDVNDGEREARELAELLEGQLASVNLIPINPVKERGFERPSEERTAAFCRALTRRHITATVRREMGADIQAACGQLRNRHMSESEEKQ
ncbi:MAG: 23S rRNA (adenine(2503)-C(2))-methyltransferase RlmN, partial [Selenomonas sp.]